MLEDKVLFVYKSTQWSWEERMYSPIVFMQVPFSSLVKTKIHCGQKKREVFLHILGGFFLVCIQWTISWPIGFLIEWYVIVLNGPDMFHCVRKYYAGIMSWGFVLETMLYF